MELTMSLLIVYVPHHFPTNFLLLLINAHLKLDWKFL